MDSFNKGQNNPAIHTKIIPSNKNSWIRVARGNKAGKYGTCEEKKFPFGWVGRESIVVPSAAPTIVRKYKSRLKEMSKTA
jgi:hypothetical protein